MTEEQILLDFTNGRIDSLYREWYRKLILYASRQLGYDLGFMAEDCVQEAIYKTYQARNTLNSPFAFKSFLYACVHNQTVSILRKQSARENYLSSSEEEEDFQNSYIEQETLDLLFHAIDNLPPKYKMLFDLSFEQGLKNAEVAKILSVSESAVKKQKAFLIQRLRDELKKTTDKDFMRLLLFLMP